MSGARAVDRYVKLLRIKISLAYFFPLVLGFSVAADADGNIASCRVVLAFAAFFCASFFASTLNFYADVEADRGFTSRFKDMDLKNQPFVTGEMGRRETVAAFVVSACGCVALSLVVGLNFSVYMIGFALVIGVLYSHPWFRLKAKPVTDILCNAVGMGLTLMAGVSLADPPAAVPVLFLLWGALFITVVYVPTVVNDVPFDEKAGLRTSGVVFGAQRLLYSMVPLTAAMIPPAVLIGLSQAVWQFKVMAGAGTVLALAGVSAVIYFWEPPHIELNPDYVLIPMDVCILFFVVYGIVRIS